MSRFLPLTVTEVRRETRDAVAVTLAPRPGDEAAFAFTEGQYLTFRRRFGDEEVRRSYSICAGRDDGILRVGIKRVPGGLFSTWANEALAPGMVLEALPPAGSFHTQLAPDRARHILLVAGGSGITPVLSLIRTFLVREPRTRLTLVYGNRGIAQIMFREELEDLKNLHLGRLAVLHVLEAEAQEIDLFTGRVDAAKCAALFRDWIDPAALDMAFVCGPEPMMLAVQDALAAHGMPRERVKIELFAAPGAAARPPRPATAAPAAAAAAACTARITLDGATREVLMPKEGPSVLEAALGAAIDAPFACKAGICSTCRAMLLEGEVEMQANHALEDYEVRRGYILTCQSRPLTDRIAVSYDL